MSEVPVGTWHRAVPQVPAGVEGGIAPGVGEGRRGEEGLPLRVHGQRRQGALAMAVLDQVTAHTAIEAIMRPGDSTAPHRSSAAVRGGRQPARPPRPFRERTISMWTRQICTKRRAGYRGAPESRPRTWLDGGSTALGPAIGSRHFTPCCSVSRSPGRLYTPVVRRSRRRQPAGADPARPGNARELVEPGGPDAAEPRTPSSGQGSDRRGGAGSTVSPGPPAVPPERRSGDPRDQVVLHSGARRPQHGRGSPRRIALATQ
jgi:hypothetical protein